MSLARAVSASQASEYYYEKDSILAPEGKGESSFWFGQLAERMDLRGRIEDSVFSAAISGLDPRDPESAKIIQDGVNKEHRAGVDLAYSPPKSFSVVALHLGDNRLIDIHNESVRASLAYYEQNYAYARKTINNKTTPDFTGNILAACFTHSTSRSTDPQLHTHAVVVNMTETERGMRAIDNYQLFNQQNILLNIYQSELAVKTKELGYQIEIGRNGNWEIAGVDKEILDAFSKRSKEIEEAAQALKKKHPEWTEAKIRDVATLQSRDSKDTKITEADLREQWEQTVSREQIRSSIEQVKSSEEVKIEPKTVLQEAAKAIHENESTFRKEDLLNTALRLSRGRLLVSVLEAEMKSMLSIKELQKVSEKTRSGYSNDLISTKEQIEMEKTVLEMAREGKNAMSPIMSANEIPEKLKKSGLTLGQESMVANMLSSEDRFTIVQGDAGTGKTFAVHTFKEIVQSVNPEIKIQLMGFTGRAAYELERATGVNASTIDGFLLAQEKNSEKKHEERSVWIVDEASMVSSKHFFQIMNLAKEKNASVHFVGDGKQLQAVGAGRLFKDLQALNVVKTVEMGEVLRQRTGYMKHLVENIKNYQEGHSSDGIINAFDVMKDKQRIIEEPGAGDRISKAVDLYLTHYSEGESVIMITPINKKRQALNDAIRDKLKANGELKEGQLFSTKQVVSLSGASRRLAGSYEEGMHIFLSSNYAGIRAGSEGVIKEVNSKSNNIKVTFNDREITIDVGRYGEKVSAFKVEEREFSEGDKIVFGKNDKKLQVQNGSVGTIKHIISNELILKMEDGSERKFDTTKTYNFLDHGYALTVHKSQGQTADVAILYTDAGTNSKENRSRFEKAQEVQKKQIEKNQDPESVKKIMYKLKHEKSRFQATTLDNPEALSSINTSEVLYVAATRAKDDFFIITDSAEDLLLQTSHEQNKTSTVNIEEIKRSEIREQINESFKKLSFYSSQNKNKKDEKSESKNILNQVEELKKKFTENNKTNEESVHTKAEELKKQISLIKLKELKEIQNGKAINESVIEHKVAKQKELLLELFGSDNSINTNQELLKYEKQEKSVEQER